MITSDDPAIITCPIIGGFPSQNPHHPRDFDDIVRHGVDAAAAGAAILHIHARTREGERTQDPGVYAELATAIRARAPEVIVNFTTGGSPGMSEDERLGPLRAHPELASLDCGSLNFGPMVFENPPDFIERAAGEMRDAGVKPEIECFEAGMVVAGARLVERGLIDVPPLFQLVLGVPGGAPARVDTLCHLVALLPPGRDLGGRRDRCAALRRSWPRPSRWAATSGRAWRTSRTSPAGASRRPTRSWSRARRSSARASAGVSRRRRRRGRSSISQDLEGLLRVGTYHGLSPAA